MEPKAVRRSAGVHPARHVESRSTLNALVAGTVVLTMDGALPVEFINAGDRVITRDSGVSVVRALRPSTVRVDTVQIRKGVMGTMRPDRDVTLPADQEILLRDWRAETLFGEQVAMVPAARLVDGEFIRHTGVQQLDLIELLFDAPHVIYADGLELASGVLTPEPA